MVPESCDPAINDWCGMTSYKGEFPAPRPIPARIAEGKGPEFGVGRFPNSVQHSIPYLSATSKSSTLPIPSFSAAFSCFCSSNHRHSFLSLSHTRSVMLRIPLHSFQPSTTLKQRGAVTLLAVEEQGQRVTASLELGSRDDLS
jgi:hypothetical protein